MKLGVLIINIKAENNQVFMKPVNQNCQISQTKTNEGKMTTCCVKDLEM